VAPDIDAQLTINELMAVNVLTVKDGSGVAYPWVELFNPTDTDIPLGGYAFSDDPSMPFKSIVDKSVAVPAHGHLLLWCASSQSTAGPTHIGVSLSQSGGHLLLSRPDRTLIQHLEYGAQETDLSAAREPDGAASWNIEWSVTPGAANPGGPAPGQVPGSGQVEMVPAAGDVSDEILRYDAIPEFELQISPDAIAVLRMQTVTSSPTQWVQATIKYRNRSYGPVGVSLKGTRSFKSIDEKAAFRVNISKYAKNARLFGLQELVLNNMTTDYAMMYERLAYWVARKIGGLPALRANHALVRVNGIPYGLYANVEAVKKEFLGRWYKDASGALYSIHYADFDSRYLNGFNLQSGQDNMTGIRAVTDALTMPAPDAAMAVVAQHIDMDEFARYWAYCIVVGQFSSKWPYAAQGEKVGNDAALYNDPVTSLMTLIPEGTDDTFYSADFDFRNTNSVLTETCKKSPLCFQRVRTQVWATLSQVEQLDWVAESDRVAAQIAPYIATDSRKPYSDTDVTMYQQQMKYFMAGRRITVGRFISAP
jgi:hypothetical protein